MSRPPLYFYEDAGARVPSKPFFASTRADRDAGGWHLADLGAVASGAASSRPSTPVGVPRLAGLPDEPDTPAVLASGVIHSADQCWRTRAFAPRLGKSCRSEPNVWRLRRGRVVGGALNTATSRRRRWAKTRSTQLAVRDGTTGRGARLVDQTRCGTSFAFLPRSNHRRPSAVARAPPLPPRRAVPPPQHADGHRRSIQWMVAADAVIEPARGGSMRAQVRSPSVREATIHAFHAYQWPVAIIGRKVKRDGAATSAPARSATSAKCAAR
jgi:hypothetical protein